ncbi:unnamed protein product [Ceutorhynchus assimilis]|uniref:Brain tumor protein n=1 Tax=Ceutorhynchus assimilis TaxID=467358 RepID=A0A9N9QMM8_9CUCU|nr:unnamed protein product [Ceutorhynchus assimilis]
MGIMSSSADEFHSSDPEGYDMVDSIELNGKIGDALDEDEALLSSDPDVCAICSETLCKPRMLYCLHTFCEMCLDKKIIGEGGDAGYADNRIICPVCNFESKVGSKKTNCLPLDVTKTNVSDVSHSTNPTCTSCTAKEVAKSRCNTCHNLLCNNCDTAHHYMRCFEWHTVVALDEMRKEGIKITVHKPLECDLHAGENMIFNCLCSNVLICAVCAKTEHKGHTTEAIGDSETRVRQEMEALLAESRAIVDNLMKSSTNLHHNLEELAHQRSAAKDLIIESHQSFKAFIDEHKEECLKQLNQLYHDRFCKLMKHQDDVSKTIDNFEDACKYTQKLLENGTVQEMMYLKNIITKRLVTLNPNKPISTDNAYWLEFKSTFDQYRDQIKEQICTFITEEDNQRLQTNGATSSASSVQSFEGIEVDNNNVATYRAALSSPLPHVTATPALQGFSSIAEFNLAQLATLAETTNGVATAQSPPAFNLADLLINDTAYKNLASLAKLGLNDSFSVDPGSGSTMAANGGNLLVRSTSNVSLNLGNGMINGFGGVSTSTSPLLHTPDDIISNDGTMGSVMTTAAGSTPNRTTKVAPMQIRCKFGQLGPSKCQFNSPHGFCLGAEEDIIVADTNNHRIQIFDKTGSFKFQFGIPGKEEGQLWYPRKVAVMRNTGKYVVCDRGNERSRMQIFTKNGHFLKKIAIRYIDIVAGLAVTATGEIVAVDSVSPTVFIIHENGELLRWFDCSDYMREPSDIAIHGKEFYVCDFKGHNVVVFNEEGKFLRRIGAEDLTNFPNGIDISDAGDVLIGDSHGNRFHVAVFSRDGSLVSEFECPYVKVSRCCGLKITSEGYVVTLAKNNHHVLVLNTLYILPPT